MIIAVPTSNGVLNPHFGHCEEFTLVDVDESAKTIRGTNKVPAPSHQPGMLPPWLAQQGAKVILAGGMGPRAVDLFTQSGIAVHLGAPEEAPETLVQAFLGGTLQLSDNSCDHPDEGHSDSGCGRH